MFEDFKLENVRIAKWEFIEAIVHFGIWEVGISSFCLCVHSSKSACGPPSPHFTGISCHIVSFRLNPHLVPCQSVPFANVYISICFISCASIRFSELLGCHRASVSETCTKPCRNKNARLFKPKFIKKTNARHSKQDNVET